MEVWKDIEGYEGLYQVSNLGRVKRIVGEGCSYERIIAPHTNQRLRRVYVMLSKGGKRKNFTIHRLVANAFIPNPNNLPEVNHIDEDPSNNVVDNLEWCTKKYNINYGTAIYRIRKSNPQCIKCVVDGVVYDSLGEASRYIGCDKTRLWKYLKRKIEFIDGFRISYK